MGLLVLAEVSKKQYYIFGSNKLKENVGASFIIRYVTEELPKALLEAAKGFKKQLLAGGGKSFFYFENETEGKTFIEQYSKNILKTYPGLEMFFVGVTMDWQKDLLSDQVDKAYKRLGEKKSQRQFNTMQMSFGKERLCSSTGLPAVKRVKGEEARYISEAIETKLAYVERHNDSSKDLFEIGIPAKELVKDLDAIGQKGDKNYIAIVHIDGNKMGVRFEALRQECEAYLADSVAEFNRFYEERMSYLSDSIDKAYKAAFKAMIEGNKLVRPLILAGDDVCFICHAEDALELSKRFLDVLSNYKIKGQAPLHGSAGIAIVKSHYPFMKGYELAEELCSLCKAKILKEELEDCNMIDWHIVHGELEEGIHSIRQRDYEYEAFNLTYRPLLADRINGEKRYDSYENFTAIQEELNKRMTCPDDPAEYIARSKVKKMRDVYLKGIEHMKVFIQLHGLKMDFAGKYHCDYGFYPARLERKECQKPTAAYYDAIEIMDFEREEGIS